MDNRKPMMRDYSQDNWWSSSYFPQINLYFMEIDSRVVLAFLPLGLHFHQYTFWFAISVLILFVGLGYIGYPVPVAIKLSRKFYAGRSRYVSTNKRRRRQFNHA